MWGGGGVNLWRTFLQLDYLNKGIYVLILQKQSESVRIRAVWKAKLGRGWGKCKRGGERMVALLPFPIGRAEDAAGPKRLLEGGGRGEERGRERRRTGATGSRTNSREVSETIRIAQM